MAGVGDRNVRPRMVKASGGRVRLASPYWRLADQPPSRPGRKAITNSAGPVQQPGFTSSTKFPTSQVT